jgi:hypothetical protein
MSAFDIIQAVVIALVVAYSLLVSARKLAPEPTRRLLGACAARLDRPVHGPILRRIGRWLQPAEARSGGCGSGDGCGTCGGCAPPPEIHESAPVPVHFHPRHRS